jgi:NADPH:quinone reductase-like Zn-dependent oxidoreductase
MTCGPRTTCKAPNACYELLPPGLELDLVPLESAWPELRARLEGGIKMPTDPIEAALFTQVTTKRLMELAGLVDKGALRVHVDKTFPLEEAGAALQRKFHPLIGNLLLE